MAALRRPQCIGVPFRAVAIVDRHERRLAALREAHVARVQSGVDLRAEPQHALPRFVRIRLRHARRFVDSRHAHLVLELDLAFVDEPLDGRGARRLRRRGKRNMPFAREQPRCRIETDPARARQIHFAPRVQIGEVGLGAARAVERLHVGCQLDQIAGHEACGEAEVAAQLHEQPAAVAARARCERKRLLGRLHARLEPHDVADVVLQPPVQRDEKVDGARRRAIDRFDIRTKRVAGARGGIARQIRRELAAQCVAIVERKGLRVLFQEKIEWVVDRHLGDEVDRDLERARALGKHEPRHVVRERILLPVDEVLRGLDLHRVRQDRRAAMRRGAQAHDLRAEPDEPVVAVAGDVVKRDVNGHDVGRSVRLRGRSRCGARRRGVRRKAARGGIARRTPPLAVPSCAARVRRVPGTGSR
ncbi:Uncharacterised protein [Burkholderia pseudomallei]|nr:Uncharacterised protein [Burkholderia pseudomallei]